MLISALPGLAASGDNMILGQKNNALKPTKLVSRGGMVLHVGIPNRSALTLVVVGDEPPMKVNSTGLVTNLNADLLDGLDSTAFSLVGHTHAVEDHGGGCPFGLVMRGLNAAGQVMCTVPPALTTIDATGNVGEFSSLVLDSSGFPVISYYDNTNDDLKVAHCSNASCIGATMNTVDATGGVGEYTSLALDSSGFPVISYHTATNGDLKVAHCSDANCTAATINTVDSTGIVGHHTSLALDSSGYPVISYYDNTNWDLKVAHCTDANCTAATINTVDSTGIVGHHTSLVLDASGFPVISYYDATNDDLKVAFL
jgi:hypothetical protein